MFQEVLAKQTAAHLREHIGEYLQLVDSEFTGVDKITLKVPTVDSVTLVGGVMQASLDKLPLLGVDCVEKQEVPSGESLYYYQYDGAIAGLVTAASAHDVDRLVKRYASAVEHFFKNHQFLHEYETSNFMVREFLYGGTTFSGAIELQVEESQPLWVDGFTMVAQWFTSENYTHQHA